MKNLIKKLIANESGASAIEYALIAAILGIGLVAGLQGLRTQINTNFQQTGTALQSR